MLAQVKRIHLWPYTMQFSNEIISLSSSSSLSSSPMRCCYCYCCCCCCCCIVHKGKFISGTIYFFPGSDVYCSALFFFIMIPIHSLELYFVRNQRQCLLGKHTRSSNESMLQKSCCSDFLFFFSMLLLPSPRYRCLLAFHSNTQFVCFLWFAQAKHTLNDDI